jgi:hypothetical protein
MNQDKNLFSNLSLFSRVSAYGVIFNRVDIYVEVSCVKKCDVIVENHALARLKRDRFKNIFLLDSFIEYYL